MRRPKWSSPDCGVFVASPHVSVIGIDGQMKIPCRHLDIVLVLPSVVLRMTSASDMRFVPGGRCLRIVRHR